ncbi:hypothetical protein LEP1GSC043_2708 [Leptospira weilii str. Ecochallenge]|uniref:Uncharacterized protein n=3 Tax=Leptospira weilii TaxID=28184 RepID=N1UB30_9LEPT|nr:hypothetical protein LEP1GSC038_2817 [Leptospira weilii str. 2006001855]EMN88573.1 hypothetical protein LEP1GSC108_0612 [Leptospira weilii str. UI 13098]EMY16312.1 hypothetical protein LEP1GSC043_2708 [Leptospira weilii str. Ecochallenge]
MILWELRQVASVKCGRLYNASSAVENEKEFSKSRNSYF